MMRKPILIIFLLQLLFSMIGANFEGDSKISSFRRTKMLEEKCMCDNPCGTPCTILSPPPPSLPPEYSYPPPSLPPPVWSYPPPPPPYTPSVPWPPFCPPPPWAEYSPPYYPWLYTPPGNLYPEDPLYHPNGARRSVSLGRFATTAAAAVAVGGGVLALW